MSDQTRPIKSSKKKKQPKTSSLSSSTGKEPDETSSDTHEQNDDGKVGDTTNDGLDEYPNYLTEDDDSNEISDSGLKNRPKNRSNNWEKEASTISESSSRATSHTTDGKNKNIKESTSTFTSSPYFWILVASVLTGIYFWSQPESSDSSTNDNNWRLKVDPNNTLSNDQQFIVRASLKPILDKSSAREEGVSTLLILSSNEENAAKLARCLLGLVNTETQKDQVSTEIDLKSHLGGKLTLDSNLKSLLSPGGGIRAVLLRHIDKSPPEDALDQLRLLFAYCDGENPVVPHRLIIMTATSKNVNENELRERFKTSWPKEHDFVDALMSRISGHTLYVEKDQKSIC